MPPPARPRSRWPFRLVEHARVGRAAFGDVDQDDPVVGPEDLARDLADALRRDRQVAGEHLVDEARVVEQGRVHRQPIGALLDP